MANILVADDDQQYPFALAKILEKQKHTVVIAHDGEEALRVFSSQKFDLVITDIMMPNVDGIDLIMSLLDKNSTVPIIAMSGGNSSVNTSLKLQTASILGVQAILKKPFTNDQLFETVNNVLAR